MLMMDAWERSTYPLQIPFKGSALARSPTEEADKSSSDPLQRDTESTHDPAQRYRSVTEDRGNRYSTTSQPGNESNLSSSQAAESVQAYDGLSTAVLMSHRSTSPPLASCDFQSRPGEAEGPSSLIRHQRNRQAEEDQVWTRSEYPRATTETFPEYHPPLPISTSSAKEESEQVPKRIPSPDQNGAIHRTLRRTPRSRRIDSPVAPTEDEDASPPSQMTENEVGIAASSMNAWKRKLYPASSAPTEHPAPRASNELQNRTSLARLGENEEPSTETTSRDRPVDPEQLFTNDLTLESEAEDSTDIPAHHPQNRNRAARRQAYPLQSMASVATFRVTLTPPPSPKQNNKTPADQLRENDQAATTRKSRQIYPLQSPASVPSFQRSPPSPPAEELPKTAAPSAKKSRDVELATKVVNQWRRQTLRYPLQSSETVPPLERLPKDETEKIHNPRSIHLPKHIRAVKDATCESQGRTICVLLDGTGDKYDNDNSNIVHLVSALKKDDPRQVTYYQAGIGTYGEGGLTGGISAAMDMAVGSSLGLHIRDAYHFLMHTYKEGDKICIFSFSRGAYTARCLAGMIHKVGLLPPRNTQQISFAYEFYKNDTPEGWKQSSDFKKTFCMDVNVYFLGCFDSVASVGFIPRQLPLSSTPMNKSRYFRHAMALDERRAKFKVCRHQTKTWDEIKKVASPAVPTTKSAQSEVLHCLPNYKDQDDAPPSYSPQTKPVQTNQSDLTDKEYERLTGHETPFETDVLEVWFAGAHADVGGGAVPNEERHKLAQIPLRWMIRQAFECDTGIIFRTAVLAEHGLDVHTLWPEYERLSAPTHEPPPSFLEKYEKGLPPRSIRRSKLVPTDKHENGEHFYHLKSHTDEDWTPEQVEDFFDAMSPLNDQLVQVPNWWILEFLPVQYKVPLSPGQVSVKTGMNLGRYRGVEDIEPNVHWTVLHRVKHIGYSIKARTASHATWRTVV